MTNVNAVADSSQVEGGCKNEQPPSAPPPGPAHHGGSKVYKSGPLFLSSKGIGWTSWKKRWFILTQTSLVFYRSDPNVIPQKGSEVNLTLGGIDLNSSGSVVVKEDKKLITVLFTDGRDGRAFTLKAETLEDLHDWKTSLEEALSNAPNAALVMGQNGLFRNNQSSATDLTPEQSKDKQTAKSLVIGRPILLALEDIDGTPSFLEKALRFLEEHGVKTEGILRQAADVEDVERRVQEYEKGKNEFSHEEDPHVIADCIKHVLRELPSPPVPASCCKALLEAYRTERSMRMNAMRSAICETFPEPNRRLLQRILTMMQAVAYHKAVNRMSVSAVAACMAPLLLRPLLAGDCDIDNDFDMGGDGSVQLLQAAAAANHAQAIVITLLEEYNNIFGDGADTHEPYTDSEESGSESEEITDDDSYDEDGDDASEESGSFVDENTEHRSSSSISGTDEDQSKEKVSGSHSPGPDSPDVDSAPNPNQNLISVQPETSLVRRDSIQGAANTLYPDEPRTQANNSLKHLEANLTETSLAEIPSELSHRPTRNIRRPTVWGRTPAKKNLSMESIELPSDVEAEIEKIGSGEMDLEIRISNEAIAKSLLQDTLERRKHDLHERRLGLEKDVARLQAQLQQEMDLRTALEAALQTSKLPVSVSSLVDEKMKAALEEIVQAEVDVTNLKKQADDLDFQLNEEREQNSRIGQQTHHKRYQNINLQNKMKENQLHGGATATSNTTENSSGTKQTDVLSPRTSNSARYPKATNATQNSKVKDTAHNMKETGSSKRESSTMSRKSSTKIEERRSQIATELQSLDKCGDSSQPVHNLEHGKGLLQHRQSAEKFENKQQEARVHTSEISVEQDRNESHRNLGAQSLRDIDRGRRSEEDSTPDWGRSENYSTTDKGPSKAPTKTYSR